MNPQDFKEDLSISYLRAIAAQAGVTFELRRKDGDSKDVDLCKNVMTNSGDSFNAEFSVQLKATCSSSVYTENEDTIKYNLKVKNYNDLCKKGTKEIILCLLVLPDNSDEWVTQSANDLVLKRCMYWYSLKGNQESSNSSTVTIEIPKTNIMSVETMQEMICKIANGGTI